MMKSPSRDWDRSPQWSIVSAAVASLLVVAGLSYALTKDSSGPRGETKPLVLYCAAGVKPPVDQIAAAYEREFGVPIRIRYDGSGKLLASIEVAVDGDLYLAADPSYINIARERGLVAESLPVARMTPVIAVAAGNPKQIRGVADLKRDDVRVVLCNPESASIGKLTESLLRRSGDWEEVLAAAKVLKPTVSEAASDLLVGSVDAAVLWDAVVNQHDDRLDAVEVSAFYGASEEVTIGVLTHCDQPAAALAFARYLQAPEKGQQAFAEHHYATVDGDAWAEHPRLLLFSGGVNRIGATPSLDAFERREGVQLERVFNGCGILVGQMRGGAKPDAYFACDVSFMDDVAARFDESLVLSETDMVIITGRDSGVEIESAAELARPGLKVGIANAEQSALGALTKRMFQAMPAGEVDLYEAITPNVAAQAPTADLLVNQVLVGALDAAVVYAANLSQVLDKVAVAKIDSPLAVAIQPIAVSKTSQHRYLTQRLVRFLSSEQTKRDFEQAGFRWKLEEQAP